MNAQRMITLLLIWFSMYMPLDTHGADNVVATLRQDSAWMGQAIQLEVVLYSPSPFAGTASFELPDVPRTVIIKTGSPVVGSEQVDDETLFTQRHTFSIFTQQSGKVTIPGFPVHFSAKASFDAPAVELTGVTQNLQFQSNRPPGTENLPLVVSATNLSVAQSWSTDDDQHLVAGDVVSRTIRQSATDTASMMLSPPTGSTTDREESDPVRVFHSKPVLSDQMQRGESNAKRQDILKYQFQSPGTVTLPDLTFTWWDPENEVLQQERVKGTTFTVEESPSPAATTSAENSQPNVASNQAWQLAGLLIVTGLLFATFVWIHRNSVNSPIEVARKRLLAACRCNDASTAYQSLLQWRRLLDTENTITISADLTKRLDDCQTQLASILYSQTADQSSWNGAPLNDVVQTISQTHRLATIFPKHRKIDLPALNPTDVH